MDVLMRTKRASKVLELEIKRYFRKIKNADNKFIMDLTDEMDIQEVFSDLRTYLIQ